MRNLGYHFGHPVYCDQDDMWKYIDTDEIIDDVPKRKCPKCNLIATDKDHDPCIGTQELKLIKKQLNF